MSSDPGTSPTAKVQLTSAQTVSAPASAIEVRRSTRRRRTVSAYRDGDRTIILIPARMSAAEEQRWVTLMLDKLAARENRKVLGHEALAARATQLSRQYLDGQAVPETVRWVTNQNTRWGSCTPTEASIRLSHRLQGMPEYVVDYVLLHELAHLIVPGHGPEFWKLLETYPRTERARGYLEGVAAASRLPHLPLPPARHGDHADAARTHQHPEPVGHQDRDTGDIDHRCADTPPCDPPGIEHPGRPDPEDRVDTEPPHDPTGPAHP